MKPRSRTVLLLMIAVLLCCLPATSEALLYDKKGAKWNLIGKMKAQATFRTVDTPDNNPIPIEAGDLISQRNLLMMEFTHNLGEVFPRFYVEYLLQGRAYIDGVWTYGPDIFSDDYTRSEYLFDNRDQINDLQWDADLFLGYIDFTMGPFFTRIGRQIISWGEMSTKRILDGTNPLDTSSLSVDMLERLIPLFIIRTNLAFESVGPFPSIGLEGYYVPGCVDNTNGEDMIDGSSIIPPIGRNMREDLVNPFSMSSLMQIVEQVPDDFDADRYGVKLNMLVGDLELNFAYYRAYSDVPVPFLDIDAFDPIYLTWPHIGSILGTLINDPSNFWNAFLGDQKLRVLLRYDKVDVYGGSFNYYLGAIDTVFRGEMALFKSVPKISPGSIGDLVTALGGKVYLPGGNVTLGDLLSGIDFGDFGGMTLPFSSGNIATYDVVKYGIAMDKNIFTFLNPKKEIMLMLEYVGSKIIDYEEGAIIYAWQGPNGETVYEPEYTNDFILIARTEYLNGLLIPQLTMFYEVVPRALVLIPAVTVTKGRWLFECSYFHTFARSYEQEGFLATRNEIALALTYNF